MITQSVAPDFELRADLRRSVLQYWRDPLRHHMLVRSDLKLFGWPAGARAHICCKMDLPPRWLDGPVDFLGGNRPADLGAMISAKPRNPLAVQRVAFVGCQAARAAGHRSQTA